MDMKHRVTSKPAPQAGELVAALRALTRLDGRLVERCPQPDCPVCRPATRHAA
jgi:hypothetical protein